MMSPTSSWSRNCVPLTTRPSRTSRQGIMRRASMESLCVGACLQAKGVRPQASVESLVNKLLQGERLLERELFLIERPAHDRAGGARGLQAAEVIERGNAARGLDLERREFLHERSVEG